MSDYEKIKSRCLELGELWIDPDFPAIQTSVFYHQTPPFDFVWKRPKVHFDFFRFFKAILHLRKCMRNRLK